MKAAVYTSYGPPDVVQIQDVAKPEPSDNEVLIHVRVAAVNPLDMVIKGRPYLARLMTGLRPPRVTRVGVLSPAAAPHGSITPGRRST